MPTDLFPELFDVTLTLKGTHMPGQQTEDYFPLPGKYADRHQLRMADAIHDDNISVVGNINPTGSGKTLSWLAPTIRSGESGDGWIVLAVYPTRALIENQRQEIQERFADYYSANWPAKPDGHTLRDSDDGLLIQTADETFPLSQQVRSITGDDTINQTTGEVIMEALTDATTASQAGIPTVVLTTPDMLTLLATNRVRSADATQFPGLVDAVIVDEFHLANPRGKRLLPFHLDAYMRLTEGRFLDTLVFLSATPDAEVVEQLSEAFTTEIIGPDAYSDAIAVPTAESRQILPETDFHLTSRPMFSNGEWLASHADAILTWHTASGQTLIIVDSVREVEVLSTALTEAAPAELTVGDISGWHEGDRQATIESADIIIGNSAVEVGVDFDRISRLICTAYDTASGIQRIGRMRARVGLSDQQIALITTSTTHSDILNRATDAASQYDTSSENNWLARKQLQTAFEQTLSETAVAPYYDLLCAAYTRFLWERADDPLRATVTPSEECYQELVADHFAYRLEDLPLDVGGPHNLWTELGDVLDTYETHYDDGGAMAIFEAMHHYRSGSLSVLILDTTDSKQLFKEYQLGYVLRYATGEFVPQTADLTTIFERVHGRPPTPDERAHLETIDRRASGRMILTGTQSTPRQYTIEAFKQVTVWRNLMQAEHVAACFPRQLSNAEITLTRDVFAGTEHIDITGEVIAQYVPCSAHAARERYRLGPFGNVLPLTETDSIALWQDATLVHAHLMSSAMGINTTSD